MKVLVDAQNKLRIPLSDPGNEILGEQLLMLEGASNLTKTTFGELQSMLKSLWADEGIQTAFSRRNEFQLSDSVQYFLDNLDRISAKDYRPTLQDVLLCRKTTKGVIEFRIEIDKVPFLFVDVGGQRTQRQKWFQCFESVTSILFMTSISEFDQVLLEDGKTNRLKESRFIFETIVNNRIFENIPMIIFLNKLDLLKEKVARSNIGQYFEEFNDVERIQELCKGFKGNWKDLEDVKRFVLFYFLSAKQKTTRSLYHHFTVAINTNNIRIVFQDVKHSILKKNLDILLLQ